MRLLVESVEQNTFLSVVSIIFLNFFYLYLTSDNCLESGDSSTDPWDLFKEGRQESDLLWTRSSPMINITLQPMHWNFSKHYSEM
jgi:hypothetical protein